LPRDGEGAWRHRNHGSYPGKRFRGFGPDPTEADTGGKPSLKARRTFRGTMCTASASAVGFAKRRQTGPASGGYGCCRRDEETGPFAGRGLRRGLRPLGSTALGHWFFTIAGSRMDCLGHGTARKRITWTLVRGRIGPATERFENGSCGRRFAEGKSWYPGGPEGNHVDAGSEMKNPGNGGIWKRTKRTPVRGRTGLGDGMVWRRIVWTPGARKNRPGNRTVWKRTK
jgi:hypothetical protein